MKSDEEFVAMMCPLCDLEVTLLNPPEWSEHRESFVCSFCILEEVTELDEFEDDDEDP